MKPSFSLNTLSYAWFGLLALVSFSCKDNPDEPTGQGNVKIEFDNVVGAESLTLHDRTYRNASGEEYTVSQLLYYVSNITLQKKDGSTYLVPESYFLIDESRGGTHIGT